MPAERYAFDIQRHGNVAVVLMNMGEGIVRARDMPVKFLATLQDACEQVRDNIVVVVKGNAEHQKGLATFPKCSVLCETELGPCDLKATGGFREDDGVLEINTAFYDEGDDSCPVLLLIEEQLDEFIEKAKEVLAQKGGNRGAAESAASR